MSAEIRTRMDDILQEKLDVVKSHYGLKNDAELVRILITEKYNVIIEKARLLEQFKKSNEPQGVVN